MTLLRNFVLAIVLVLGFVLSPTPVTAAGPPAGLDVTVVNSPSSPVPVTINGTSTVTGNVTVTNTPNVSVTNTPNVAVTNTPTVKLAGGEPYAVGSIGTCNTFFCFFSFPVVPAGKRLVINFVNVTVRPSATTTIVDFAELATTDTSNAGTLVTNDFGFTQVGHAGASNAFNSWTVNSPTLAFVVAGQSPELEADMGTAGTIAFASATLSGYLVDAP